MNIILLTAITTAWTIAVAFIIMGVYNSIPPLVIKGYWIAFWALLLWLATSVGVLWAIIGRMS